MDRSTTQNLIYGIRKERLVHVSQVPGGLESESSCPICDLPLIAKKGSHINHHFTHTGPNPHPPADSESPLHKIAKKVLQIRRHIFVPAVGKEGIKQLFLSAMELEKPVSSFYGDVFARDEQGLDLIIEVINRHRLADEKRTFYVQNRIRSLELFVTGLYGKTDLEERILRTAPRSWIYNVPAGQEKDPGSNYFDRYTTFQSSPGHVHNEYRTELLEMHLNRLRSQYGKLETYLFTGEVQEVPTRKYGLPGECDLGVFCSELPEIFGHLALVEIRDHAKWRSWKGRRVRFKLNPDPSLFIYHRKKGKAIYLPRVKEAQLIPEDEGTAL